MIQRSYPIPRRDLSTLLFRLVSLSEKPNRPCVMAVRSNDLVVMLGTTGCVVYHHYLNDGTYGGEIGFKDADSSIEWFNLHAWEVCEGREIL